MSTGAYREWMMECNIQLHKKSDGSVYWYNTLYTDDMKHGWFGPLFNFSHAMYSIHVIIGILLHNCSFYILESETRQTCIYQSPWVCILFIRSHNIHWRIVIWSFLCPAIDVIIYISGKTLIYILSLISPYCHLRLLDPV